MRLQSVLCVGCILACFLSIGCQQTSPSATDASVAGGSEKTSAAPVGDGPDAAVYRFLEAFRAGNDTQTAQMLTPTARKKVAEHNMSVAPPGSDTARFEIGTVQLLDPDGARVTVKWTDLDEQGKPSTADVVWCLRKVDEGWRVAGVIAPVFEGEPPVVLNFEDPEDMLRKQQMVKKAEEGKLPPPGVDGASAPSDRTAQPTKETDVRR